MPLVPELYARLLEYGGTAEGARIDQHLSDFTKLEPRFSQLYSQLQEELPEQLERFQAEFPDLDPQAFDIYLLHSLGGSNGALDFLGHRRIFYLGLDMMCLHNNYPSQKAFLDHEFFHAYHLQFFPISQAFYNRLWFEGLATYVAVTLNPQATAAELQMPDPMRDEVEARRAWLLADVANHLESEELEFRQRYTWLGAGNSAVPERSGYYLGYLIARQLSQKHSIAEMAHWDSVTVLQKIRLALGELGVPQSADRRVNLSPNRPKLFDLLDKPGILLCPIHPVSR